MISLRKSFPFFFGFHISQWNINGRFCIKMPFLHRLACFRYVDPFSGVIGDLIINDEGNNRDDVVFLIFLYQVSSLS
jgi:uncharacterized membrane protein